MKVAGVPGSFYQRSGRWWWRVTLPDEDAPKNRPLKPTGARYATTEKAVAVAIAKDLLAAAQRRADNPLAFDGTVGGLATLYKAAMLRMHQGADGQPASHYSNMRQAMDLLTEFAGGEPVEAFGPLRLGAYLAWLAARPGKKHEQRLCRYTVNRYATMARHAFRWGVSQELIHVTTYQALMTVELLKRGRSEARESKVVRVVNEAHVRAVLPYASPVIAAMIEVQMYTGMRSGELCQMRPCDIDTTGQVWLYTPQSHKTEHHGHTRTIAIGPKAQAVLKPYLKRQIDAYCFTPDEALDHRTTGRGRAVQPCYNKDTYGKAVRRAIEKCQRAERKKAKKENRRATTIPTWHPHQLRHTAATIARKEFGVEAARAYLGHSSANMTELYAELDAGLAAKVAAKIG